MDAGVSVPTGCREDQVPVPVDFCILNLEPAGPLELSLPPAVG